MGDITVKTLRDWLAEHKPVTVLDVRAQEDRDQWSIRGGMHLDAYESLKHGRSDALAGFEPPAQGQKVLESSYGQI